MSRSRPSPPTTTGHPAQPQEALVVLLEGDAGNPIRRALWLDTLDVKLHPCLPPGAAAHARLANIDGVRLVYLVDSPVWHARLRLAATELLDAARSIGLGVTEVVVKTSSRPLPARSPAAGSLPPTPGTPMSAAAREAFEAALVSTGEVPPRKDPS